MRPIARKYAPDFFPTSELSLLRFNENSSGKWTKTRLWFYPESIRIDTDPTGQYARIINPQFTADAERGRDDFSSPQEFELKKKALLAQVSAKVFRTLNQHYQEYASAFPELRELLTVGRLMGICSWLKKVNPGWLDLDGLLAVELPAFPDTPFQTQQLVITTKENNSVSFHYLSPIFKQPVQEYFQTSQQFSNYLCYKYDTPEEQSARYQKRGRTAFLPL